VTAGSATARHASGLATGAAIGGAGGVRTPRARGRAAPAARAPRASTAAA